MIGHLNNARPQWPIAWARPDLGNIHYETEPIVSIEMCKRDWDEMFDMYEGHHKDIKHPAVRDAWEQYQMVRQLVKQNK